MLVQVFMKSFFSLVCYFKNMTSVQKSESSNASEAGEGASETMLVFSLLLEATCHAPIKEPVFFMESLQQSFMKYDLAPTTDLKLRPCCVLRLNKNKFNSVCLSLVKINK